MLVAQILFSLLVVNARNALISLIQNGIDQTIVEITIMTVDCQCFNGNPLNLKKLTLTVQQVVVLLQVLNLAVLIVSRIGQQPGVGFMARQQPTFVQADQAFVQTLLAFRLG